jgi:hypothetical protein
MLHGPHQGGELESVAAAEVEARLKQQRANGSVSVVGRATIAADPSSRATPYQGDSKIPVDNCLQKIRKQIKLGP